MDYVSKRLAINLTALHGSRVIEEFDEDGNLERGVFIPIERNGLYVGKKNRVYLYGYANYNHWKPNEESYQIMQSISKHVYEKQRALGYDRTMLGYMRDVDSGYTWKPRGVYVAQVLSESKNKNKK